MKVMFTILCYAGGFDQTLAVRSSADEGAQMRNGDKSVPETRPPLTLDGAHAQCGTHSEGERGDRNDAQSRREPQRGGLAVVARQELGN